MRRPISSAAAVEGADAGVRVIGRRDGAGGAAAVGFEGDGELGVALFRDGDEFAGFVPDGFGKAKKPGQHTQLRLNGFQVGRQLIIHYFVAL